MVQAIKVGLNAVISVTVESSAQSVPTCSQINIEINIGLDARAECQAASRERLGYPFQ